MTTERASGAALIVLAKAPVPGRSKTRCSPPCTPVQAAALAEAALIDTLDAVVATPAARHVLVLEGSPGPWLQHDVEVLAQCGDGLDERLASAFEDVHGPALLIGMDTPQVTPALLGRALTALADPAADAVLGPADDGGYWAIGLRQADRGVFLGVPMSTDRTGGAQLARLRALGRRTALLEQLSDVDTFATAVEVATRARPRHLAAEVGRILSSLQAAGAAAAGPPR